MQDLFQLDKLFSDDERLIRDNVRKFVDSEVIPIMSALYEKAIFPQELIPKLASLGLFGMTLPSEYGGSEANYTTYGLVCQELERGDSGLRSFVSVQSSLCMYPLFAYGTEEQKNKWLPQLAKGEKIGCFGLTEPDSGSDPASMKTTAKKVGDNWILNGSKLWITNATIADLAIVWAKTDQDIQGFIVEKDTSGFSTNEIHNKMSLRASITGELIFNNCEIPESNRLSGANKGIIDALACLSQARYGIAWGAIGAAIACYEQALSYSLERKQFSKPIAGFQLIQKDLVDMYTEIVKAQCLNLQLSRLQDQQNADYIMISMAKMNSCRQALEISRKARNILGANGISLEYHVIRHMHNLETVFTYEGTDNVHHLIIGRHLTGINAFS